MDELNFEVDSWIVFFSILRCVMGVSKGVEVFYIVFIDWYFGRIFKVLCGMNFKRKYMNIFIYYFCYLLNGFIKWNLF